MNINKPTGNHIRLLGPIFSYTNGRLLAIQALEQLDEECFNQDVIEAVKNYIDFLERKVYDNK